MITVTFVNGRELDVDMTVREFWEAASLSDDNLFYVELPVGKAAINITHVIAAVGAE